MSLRQSLGRRLMRIGNTISGDLSWKELEKYFAEGGDIATSATGVRVTQDTAMRASAVWGCVRLISAALATCPVRIYSGDRYGVRKVQADSHPLSLVLRSAANPYITAATFWRAMSQFKLLAGNAYAYIVRDVVGRPIGLLPLNPLRVRPYQAHEVGRRDVPAEQLFYYVTWDDGSWSWVDAADMIHVPNLGWDGRRGMSTVAYGAQTMGLALAAEESSARFFSNGMQAQVVLTYPKAVDDEIAKRLREQIGKKMTGLRNVHAPIVLTEGGDVKSISINARDSQLLEARQFSVVDICRFFGVPPVMIGESDKTTSWGSGVEQMGRWFTTYVLNDHFTAFEQELDRKLFGATGYFAEFDESEITRGDTTARSNFFNVARGSLTQPGYMTINEIRAAEGLPPVEGGDVLTKPEAKAQAPAQDGGQA